MSIRSGLSITLCYRRELGVSFTRSSVRQRFPRLLCQQRPGRECSLELPDEEDRKILRFVFNLEQQGVEQVLLVLGGERTRDFAASSEIVFAPPTESPIYHLEYDTVQEIRAIYLSGDEENVPWKILPRWVNGLIESVRDLYMGKMGYNDNTELETIQGELDKTMMLWSQELWAPPTFKFVEVANRKELGRLKKSLGPK